MRELGDRHSAFLGAKQHAAAGRIVDNAKHNAINTRNAAITYPGADDFAERSANERCASGGRLPHTSRRWRNVLMPERADNDGHGPKPSLRRRRLAASDPGVSQKQSPAVLILADRG